MTSHRRHLAVPPLRDGFSAPPRRRGTAALLGLAVLAVAPLPSVVAPAAAAAGPTFTVTSTGDAGDAKRDGTCLTSAGECTLRAALLEANAAPGHPTVAFDIAGAGVHTIALTKKLPGLTNPAGITIDGYTEPGAAPNTDPVASNARITVEIRGQGPGAFDALSITTPDNVIRGLAFYDFPKSLYLNGPDADRNRIVGNFVCTNAAGTFGSSKVHVAGLGILLTKGAGDNVIGAPGPENRNVVSGCFHRGITLSFGGTVGNRVQNNIVGLNPSGTAALPNRSHGVDINYTRANLVGGDGRQEGNVISGNAGAGIEISHGRRTNNNSIVGNLIGTDLSGNSAPDYARNSQWGVRLEGPKFCGDPNRPNPDSCTEEGVKEGLPHHNTVQGNVIVNNAKGGLLIDKGQHDNTVRDNLIGLTADGTRAGNRLYGLRIERGSYDNTIGPGNVISANPRGIMVSSTGSAPTGPEQRAYGNVVTRNSVFRNSAYGIDLQPFKVQNVGQPESGLVHDRIAVPVLSAGGSSATAVSGRGCAECDVEVYVADVGTAGVVGEGRAFLAAGTVRSDGTFRVAIPPSGGKVVTALVTHAAKGSSEFATTIKLPG